MIERIFIALILILPCFLNAQETTFRSYSFLENTPKGLLKNIITDDLGFVWVATDDGVIRFDGKDMRSFPDKIKGGFVKSFCHNAAGNLLVLQDNGLTEIINSPDFILFNPLLKSNENDTDNHLYFPKNIFQDSKKRIWIGEDQSVVKFTDNRIRKYRFGNNSGIGVLFRSYNFAESTNGDLWTISNNGNLFLYDETAERFITKKIEIELREVSSLNFISPQKFWVGTASGMYEILLDAEKNVESIQLLSSPPGISCVMVNSKKEMYIGTWGNGLYRLDNTDTAPNFVRISACTLVNIIDIHFDKNNGLWVNSNEEVVLLKQTIFQPLYLFPKNRPGVESLTLNADSSLLIVLNSTNEQEEKVQEVRYEEDLFSVKAVSITSGNILMKALRTGSEIWLGDLDGRVYIYSEKDNQLRQVTEIERSTHPISSIIEDQEKNIWIAGNTTHGIIRIHPDGEIEFYNDNELKESSVFCETSEGKLYIGGNDSKKWLHVFSPSENRFLNISSSLVTQENQLFKVEDLSEDKQGNVLAATSRGIFRFSPKTQKAEQFLPDKLSPSEPCYALAVSPKGVLWISKASGLLACQGVETFSFDKSSGLPSNYLKPKALEFDAEGRLWVGTAVGLAILDVEDSDFLTTPAPVFTRLQVNGKEKNTFVEDLYFEYQSALEINFISPSYPASQVYYRTRIKERNETWSVPSQNNRRFLPYLSYGDYTFEVSAQQHGGHTWSTPTKLKFSIEKPWYLRWWIVLLTTIGVVGLVTLITRWYNRHLLVEKQKLEKIVKSRTEHIEVQKNEIIEQKNRIISQNEEVRELKEKQLKDEINYRNKQLTTYTLNTIQKNEALKELSLEITKAMRRNGKENFAEYRSFLRIIDYSFRKDSEWKNFKLYFEEVYVGFFEKIMRFHPSLTQQDLRHCALIKLNLTIEEAATILAVAPNSIKTARFRLRQKMGIDSQSELTKYIMTL